MEFYIREATAADADGLQKLNLDEMGYSFPADKTAEKLKALLRRSTDKIFVAVTDDMIAGYVHACDYDLLYAPHMKNIMGIAVSAEYKGRGIGRALLEAVENWARDTGASHIRLVSGAERAGAHEFYKKCGFDVGKEQLNFKKKL